MRSLLFSIVFGALALISLEQPAVAWDTSNCTDYGRPGSCTVTSSGVQSSGNYLPVGETRFFDDGETIGTWQSINDPTPGLTRWRFTYAYRPTHDAPWQEGFDVNVTTMTVSSGNPFWNVWDDKFTHHPPGSYRVTVEIDVPGDGLGYVPAHTREVDFYVCGGDYWQRCSGGDVVWYDVCLRRRAVADTCDGGASCDSETLSCTCEPSSVRVCHDGDVYGTDACGRRTARVESCGAGLTCLSSGDSAWCGCDGPEDEVCIGDERWQTDACGSATSYLGRCGVGETCEEDRGTTTCRCAEPAGRTCVGNEVWSTLGCGELGSRVETCSAGRSCVQGASDAWCACSESADTRCRDLEVWRVDSCGNDVERVDRCDGGAVCEQDGTVASCRCVPDAGQSCFGSELYAVDSCGNPGAPLMSCAYGCVDGACGEAPTDGPGAPTRPLDLSCLISDAAMRDIDAMGAAEVQAFLEARGSDLADRSLATRRDFSYAATPYFHDYRLGSGALARDAAPADLIWQASRDPGDPAPTVLSPRVLLVMLQKEQSLVGIPGRATQHVLDWAMGYAVPDGRERDARYRGFAAQVLAGAYQLSIDSAVPEAVWRTPRNIDGVFVTPRNAATHALLTYTPHRESAENFWRLYWQYFGDPGTCDDAPVAVPPPTATGLPSDLLVGFDGSVPLSGRIEAGAGDRIEQVAVAIRGPGIAGTDERLSANVRAETFALDGFAFAPEAFDASPGLFQADVWVNTREHEPRLVGQFRITVLAPPGDDDAFLYVPLRGRTPDSVGINSVFDHAMSRAYGSDGRIVAFTGEEARDFCGADPGFSTGYRLWRDGACRPDEQVWLRGQNRWSGTSASPFLYYDNHPGIDMKSANGEDVLAPAGGVAVVTSYTSPYYGTCPELRIVHDNGFTSVFLHMNSFSVADGERVEALQVIGTVGSVCTRGAHLHYELGVTDASSRGFSHRVDPFGWQGAGSDPYGLAPGEPSRWLEVVSGIGGAEDPVVCTSTCPANTTCRAGSCVPSCTTERDCLPGEACLGGACEQVCYPVAPEECDPGVPFRRDGGDPDAPLEAWPEEDEPVESGDDAGEAASDAGGGDAADAEGDADAGGDVAAGDDTDAEASSDAEGDTLADLGGDDAAETEGDSADGDGQADASGRDADSSSVEADVTDDTPDAAAERVVVRARPGCAAAHRAGGNSAAHAFALLTLVWLRRRTALR